MDGWSHPFSLKQTAPTHGAAVVSGVRDDSATTLFLKTPWCTCRPDVTPFQQTTLGCISSGGNTNLYRAAVTHITQILKRRTILTLIKQIMEIQFVSRCVSENTDAMQRLSYYPRSNLLCGGHPATTLVLRGRCVIRRDNMRAKYTN